MDDNLYATPPPDGPEDRFDDYDDPRTMDDYETHQDDGNHNEQQEPLSFKEKVIVVIICLISGAIVVATIVAIAVYFPIILLGLFVGGLALTESVGYEPPSCPDCCPMKHPGNQDKANAPQAQNPDAAPRLTIHKVVVIQKGEETVLYDDHDYPEAEDMEPKSAPKMDEQKVVTIQGGDPGWARGVIQAAGKEAIIRLPLGKYRKRRNKKKRHPHRREGAKPPFNRN